MGIQDREILHVVPLFRGIPAVFGGGFRHAGGMAMVPLGNIHIHTVLKLALVPA